MTDNRQAGEEKGVTSTKVMPSLLTNELDEEALRRGWIYLAVGCQAQISLDDFRMAVSVALSAPDGFDLCAQPPVVRR